MDKATKQRTNKFGRRKKKEKVVFSCLDEKCTHLTIRAVLQWAEL